jgi:glutamate dehydrogenase (NAD(P)+)
VRDQQQTVSGEAIMKEGFNAFEMAQAQFDRVADMLGLEGGVRELLRWPMREFHFTIPVRMDDGSVKVFRGFRIQHNDLRGPAKGGSASTPRRRPTRCGRWRPG